MAIVSVTVTKGKAYPRNKEIIQTFEEKGLYQRTTWREPHVQLEDDVDSLKDALLLGDDEQVMNEAGNCYMSLLHILDSCNITMEQAVNYSADKAIRRKENNHAQ